MNFKNRMSGVLMHITSLPGPFGTGVLGQEALTFIDDIKSMGFSVWQILPLNLIDQYHSPYSSVSAFAGNYLLIDPRGLYQMGLIEQAELDSCRYDGPPFSADYTFVKDNHLSLLRTAFSHADDSLKQAVNRFVKTKTWAEDFSLFMSVREAQGEKHWWEWENGYSDYRFCEARKNEFTESIDFWHFTQYIFFSQWADIKEYADKKGVKIMGDIPFYVSLDSVDVWKNPDYFKLDCTHHPSCVAGVPPDYFACDGQLWGNPIYNWNLMAKDNYAWWTKRIEFMLSIYDIVRIDHFRAFSSYWSVPFGAQTAATGEWVKGPGKRFFDALRSQTKELQIIAEDLGGFEADVAELLEYTAIPGMRVVQFGFTDSADNKHLPHNYSESTVAYIGTHDNSTLLGWLWGATKADRNYALAYCGFNGADWGQGGFESPSCRCIVETVWRSSAKLCMIPIQDMCGFGDDARMNIPGSCGGNWLFRITSDTLSRIDKNYFLKINRLFKRRC